MIVANKAGSNWVPTDGPPFSACSSRSGASNTLLSKMWAYSPVDSSWPSLREDDTTTLVVLTRMRTTARCLCHCCSVPRSSGSLLSTNADRTKITAQVKEMKAKPMLVHFRGASQSGCGDWPELLGSAAYAQTLGICGCIRTSIQRGMVGDIARSLWMRRLRDSANNYIRAR